MGKNHTISGVNWASVKKFAEYTFGELEGNKIKTTQNGRHYYYIYVSKQTYNENIEEIRRFEDRFLVEIKAVA